MTHAHAQAQYESLGSVHDNMRVGSVHDMRDGSVHDIFFSSLHDNMRIGSVHDNMCVGSVQCTCASMMTADESVICQSQS